MEREEAKSFIHQILKVMRERKASDLFITVGAPPSMKIDGKVTPVSPSKLTEAQSKALVTCLMNERQAADYERTMEANFAINPEGLGRFRVNAFVQQGYMGAVLRVITSEVPSFANLDLPVVLQELALSKRGLIVFVGGTGTGKTTTLAALLNHRNEMTEGHIITIEDPIEYVHPHKKCVVTQREVGVDSLTWEAALENTLRQAPDVILMGEVRNRETMEHAMAFAETGHLCVCTLHANSSDQAIDRIINFFPEERHAQLFMDLSMNLKAMISQRLIPLKGKKGRAAAVEILINSPLVSDLIFKGEVKQIKEVMKKSRELGMQTFDQCLFDLYEAEKITYDEALRNADSLNDLRLQIKLHSKHARDEAPSEGLSLL